MRLVMLVVLLVLLALPALAVDELIVTRDLLAYQSVMQAEPPSQNPLEVVLGLVGKLDPHTIVAYDWRAKSVVTAAMGSYPLFKAQDVVFGIGVHVVAHDGLRWGIGPSVTIKGIAGFLDVSGYVGPGALGLGAGIRF